MEHPTLLVINPSPDIRVALEGALRQAFGEEFVSSVYLRPPAHPGLSPSRRGPRFTAVLVDLGLESAGLGVSAPVNGDLLPTWLIADVLSQLDETLVIALAPTLLVGAVQLQLKRTMKKQDFTVVPRELSGQPDGQLAEVIRVCWSGWSPTPRPNFLSTLRGMAEPT